MKVTVDFDCTPEEARRVMGLPDLTPIHDLYLDQMKRTIAEGVTPDTVERLMRSWGPLSDANISFWSRLFDQATKPKG